MHNVVWSWILFYGLHSLLLWPRLQAFLLPIFSGKPRYFRLFYNLLSLLLLTLAVAMLWRNPGERLWPNTSWTMLLGAMGVLFGGWMGKRAFRSYHLPVFLGLREEIQMPLNIQGMNRYVRHPLYTASLILFWSALLVWPTSSFLAVCIITSLYVFIGYRLEENRLIRHFGEAYSSYQQQVPALFPRLRQSVDH